MRERIDFWLDDPWQMALEGKARNNDIDERGRGCLGGRGYKASDNVSGTENGLRMPLKDPS